MLAVNFDDFYHQHFSGFHAFKAIILPNSFTLTSSICFGEHLNAGTKGAKKGPKLGKFPGWPAYHRSAALAMPGGLATVEFQAQFLSEC